MRRQTFAGNGTGNVIGAVACRGGLARARSDPPPDVSGSETQGLGYRIQTPSALRLPWIRPHLPGHDHRCSPRPASSGPARILQIAYRRCLPEMTPDRGWCTLVRLAPVLRHSVLWMLRETTSPELRLEMLEGLAFLGTECPMVRHGDYGEDIFGGSRDLAASPRTPMWRRDRLGPESDFDAALHL